MKITTAEEFSPEAQDATTRHRVMKRIVEHGWTTTAGLAAEFSLTPAAIRRHLVYLENTGMVWSRFQPVSLRKGAGRPAKEYAATSHGSQTFNHAYDTFAISAVESLRRYGGEEAVTRFFEDRFAAIEARFSELRAVQPNLSQAEALSIALTEDGFMAGIQPVGGGEQLCQHNCPYPAIATRFPELCAVETSVFSRLLHSHVQRLATIAHGDGVCTTNIPPSAPERKPDMSKKEDR
ncbi:MAG: transcriptional regulator [Propionibacteriaceae bacterium]|nr:transcriptional regulator [Propionibacteriaceae bacterium]